jgi:hypothetical protein
MKEALQNIRQSADALIAQRPTPRVDELRVRFWARRRADGHFKADGPLSARNGPSSRVPRVRGGHHSAYRAPAQELEAALAARLAAEKID